MDLIPQSNNGEQKGKSWLSKPDGKVGAILGIGLLGAIGYYVFPILTTIMWNTVNLMIATGAVVLLYGILSNKKLWLGLSYFYKILVKRMVGMVIELDPFIIAEESISEAERNRELLLEQATKIDGQKELLAAKIREKEKAIDKDKNKMEAARIAEDNMEVGNASRRIGRANEAIERLTPIRDNLTKIGEYLMKVHKNSRYMIDDMKDDISSKKDLYNAVTQGNNALQQALKVFKGDPDKAELLNQSMEFLASDIANKTASMKQALLISSDFMKSIDLENASYEIEGLKLLEEYNPDNYKYDKLEVGSAQPTPIVISSYNKSNYDNLLK